MANNFLLLISSRNEFRIRILREKYILKIYKNTINLSTDSQTDKILRFERFLFIQNYEY